MGFLNEKEFEFNVYYDLRNTGVPVQPLEEPFDSKIENQYVEFKKSKWNPRYHHPMIQFTTKQTTAMRSGHIPIVLVCGETSFYLLTQQKITEFINASGRIARAKPRRSASFCVRADSGGTIFTIPLKMTDTTSLSLSPCDSTQILGKITK
jgi:hypothetical protein